MEVKKSAPQLTKQPSLSSLDFAIPGRPVLGLAAVCCSEVPQSLDHTGAWTPGTFTQTPPPGSKRGGFLPTGGSAWGIDSLSHQEDAHPRGKEPESIQDLENLHVGDLRPGLWLNISHRHSKARKDEAHPGIRHTPECRGHSQRESMLRSHRKKRKHEEKAGCPSFLGGSQLPAEVPCPVPKIKRSVKKSHPVGVLSLLRRHTHQSLLMSSCGKSSRQYTRSQRKRMKYIMSGCWTNWVSESLCRPLLSRSMASPEWVAFLQKEDTGEAVTSRSPVQRAPLTPLTPTSLPN